MRRVLGLLFLSTIAFTACGDDDNGSGGANEAAAGVDTPDAIDGTTVSCTAGDGGTADVAIEDFQFQPGDIEIAAGASVTWTNADSAPHAIWSEERTTGQREWESVGPDPDALAPENLADGDASTCTFSEPGTYAYLCGVHNTMVGTVVVT
jgi:plastocyanin